MSYYNPNIYSSYPQYGTQFTQQGITYQSQPVMQPINQTTQAMQQAPILNGKVVDGIEMVKATEVPIGSYGVFPKADLNEIYIKTWNNNGTTNVITYKPTPIEIPKSKEEENLNNTILEKINLIENKLDNILKSNSEAAKSSVRKEVKSNAY